MARVGDRDLVTETLAKQLGVSIDRVTESAIWMSPIRFEAPDRLSLITRYRSIALIVDAAMASDLMRLSKGVPLFYRKRE